MQIVTSWMEEGIEQDCEQGEKELLIYLLSEGFGNLSNEFFKILKD